MALTTVDPPSRLKALVLAALPGAVVRMVHNPMEAVVDVYIVVRDPCEIPLAESLMEELRRWQRGDFSWVPWPFRVHVESKAACEDFLETLTEEEKNERRKALVQARWGSSDE